MGPQNVSLTTTFGAEIVGSIDDLLKAIFVHLPLKPLIRFKLVSKHWSSIISDPKFQFTHNYNRAVGLIFQNFYSTTRCVVSLDRSSNPPPQKHIPCHVRIFHSCNGLLVLKNTSVKKHYYYVYNPTTNRKSMPLLKDEKACERDSVHGMYLAFDPSKSPHYKVVCVWELGEDLLTNDVMHQYQFEVYSSKAGSWEIRCGWFTDYIDFHNGVYWNGAIHWLNLNGKSIYFNPDHDEMPHVMPHPPIHHNNTRDYYFGESCDHLHCAIFVGDHLARGIYVYEMRRDYSEWFVKYRVDDYSQCLRNYTVRNLFSVVRGKKDEDSLVLGTVQGEIILYNLVHNTFQTIQGKATIHGTACDFYSYKTKSFPYIESPCPV